MIKITLPVHFQERPQVDSEEDDNYKNVLRDIKGVEASEDDITFFIKDVVFYNIDTITPNIDTSGEPLTIIYSGGNEFTSPLLLEEVATIIDKALKKSGK